MRLLLFSDVHCDTEACERLVRRAADVDVIVGAGDFGSVRCGTDTTISALAAIDRPAVLVPGNAESAEELADACRGWPAARVLHGNGAVIDDVEFFGLGGGVPVTPFGSWSYDFSEEQAAELLAHCPRGCVLVTHSPPQGAVDRSSRGIRLGSVAIRETIQRVQPRLAVCGHIHECGGRQDWIGSVPVVNAGSRGIVFELDH